MNNLRKLIHTTTFLLALILVGVFTAPRIYDFAADKSAPILNGQWASTLDTYLNDQLSIKTLGVNVWAALEYKVFNEGKKGVIIGRDQWLFTDEEFYDTPEASMNLEDNLLVISEVEEKLNAQGVKLVLVLIPAKVDIYKQFIGHKTPSAFMLNHFDTIDQKVAMKATNVVSLRDIFIAYSESEPLFLRTDTHWTPLGAELAAKALSKKINQESVEYESKAFMSRDVSTREYLGDLTAFIPVAPHLESMMLDPDVLIMKETHAVVDSIDAELSTDLFGEEQVDFVLVGTSYSANASWNFEGALKESLAADIINFSTEGEGPFKPMLDYLVSDDFAEVPPQVLIWEVPVRYLTENYSLLRSRSSAQLGVNLQ